MSTEQEREQEETQSKQHKRKSWRRQWVGVFAGAAIGLALNVLFPPLADRFSSFSVVIWCAVLGGVLTSLDGFIRAGAALTRSENRWLNLSVGLGIPILILILLRQTRNQWSRKEFARISKRTRCFWRITPTG